jgi:hypothetical protein
MDLTGPQKRELEASLREAGLSIKQALTAVSIFASFLLQREAESRPVGLFRRYWAKLIRKVKLRKGNTHG